MTSLTGLLRARRQNVPVQSHTVARIGGHQDHHLHQHQQNMFSAAAVSPPPLQSVATGGQLQQPPDLASTVDLTADSRAPIDYLTPPPNADFQFLQQSFPAGEPTTPNRPESHVQNVQAPPPPPLVPLTAPSAPVAVHTSPFTPSGGAGGGGGFPSAQTQPPPSHGTSFGSLAVQTSSPSNQVNSLTFANPPLEQFTPYTPSLQVNDPAANHQHQQQQNGGRWELGFDASEILTPPFLGGPEQPSGGSGQTFFHQDFGQETASSVRNNKQYPASGGGSLFFGGSGFDASTAANAKFTPLDAVIRPSSSNKNVYWGTPKTAQQQPLRPPSPSFVEPNAFRFNSNNNHLHQLHHNNHNPHHHHQYVDAFQMPFTGQFDGPLSQGTVTDHVVHSSFRIKRQLRDVRSAPSKARSDLADRRSDDDGFGDRKPVYSFVKTDRNGNFKWSVRHGY